MNRREFTRNMLAAATIPALPVPSLAKAQAVVVSLRRKQPQSAPN